MSKSAEHIEITSFLLHQKLSGVISEALENRLLECLERVDSGIATLPIELMPGQVRRYDIAEEFCAEDAEEDEGGDPDDHLHRWMKEERTGEYVKYDDYRKLYASTIEARQS